MPNTLHPDQKRYATQAVLLRAALDLVQNGMGPVTSDAEGRAKKSITIDYLVHLIKDNEELSRGFYEFAIKLDKLP